MAALSNKNANLFSDLALHAMGPGLADDILQGLARGDEFRTAPLWGLGKRVFFLHDGRTTDLVEAIREHKSDGNSRFGPSEANEVIDRFNRLDERREARPAELPALAVALAGPPTATSPRPATGARGVAFCLASDHLGNSRRRDSWLVLAGKPRYSPAAARCAGPASGPSIPRVVQERETTGRGRSSGR